MNRLIHTFETIEEQVTALAGRIIDVLDKAIAERGVASLAVSGGSTPKPLFEVLSTSEIDWSKVTVSLVDDRWVDINDDNSNEKLVRNSLLVKNASKANFISLKTEDENPLHAEAAINERLQTLPDHLDVVLLGMGDDGHTASLFPCADEDRLAMAMDLSNYKRAQAITPTTAPFDRMTLTASYLLRAKFIALMVKGESKKITIDKALSATDRMAMPIRLFIHPKVEPTYKGAETFLALQG